jgi:hypothetical protein
MRRLRTVLAIVSVATAGLIAVPTAAAAAAPPVGATTQHYSGTLADGAQWIADVPAQWNKTIILYSHGYGPLVAQDAPDAATQQALLDRGYALVGSSYSGPSWWALASAVNDQFSSLHKLEAITGRPHRTIAWGTSMGGLVSALEAQQASGRIDGALTTCGLVAGAVNMNNYQLDGEYALAHLLAPDQSIKLVNYATQDEAAAAASALTGVVSGAQNSAAGRARTALGAALMNEPGWFTGPNPPARFDYAAQEMQQAQELTAFVLGFIMTGRYQIELAGGGNSAFNVGVDYAKLLRSSDQFREVRALYRKAGLSLNADLDTLTRDASVRANRGALATLAHTSMVSGRLQVPELDIHTIGDQLVPVEQETWYAKQVRRAGSNRLFRQAYVRAAGHCNFTTAGTIAALHALEHRLDTGRWANVTDPRELNAAAAATGLGAGHYIRFRPGWLTGARSYPHCRHHWHARQHR